MRNFYWKEARATSKSEPPQGLKKREKFDEWLQDREMGSLLGQDTLKRISRSAKTNARPTTREKDRTLMWATGQSEYRKEEEIRALMTDASAWAGVRNLDQAVQTAIDFADGTNMPNADKKKALEKFIPAFGPGAGPKLPPGAFLIKKNLKDITEFCATYATAIIDNLDLEKCQHRCPPWGGEVQPGAGRGRGTGGLGGRPPGAASSSATVGGAGGSAKRAPFQAPPLVPSPELSELVEKAHREAGVNVAGAPADFVGILCANPGAHTPVAEYLARVAASKFRHSLNVSAAGGKNDQATILLFHDGVIWKEDPTNQHNLEYYCISLVANPVVGCVVKLLDEAVAALAETADGEPAGGVSPWSGEAILLAQERAWKLSESLRLTPFLKNVWQPMESLMKAHAFCEKIGVPTPEQMYFLLDSRPDAMAMTNGVVDFRLGRFFPKGQIPDGYEMQMSTGVEWIGAEDLRPKDEEQRAQMQEVEGLLVNKVFFQAPQRVSFRSALGSVAFSSVSTKKPPSLLGSGDNGKSELVRWIRSFLGDYCGTMNKCMIVQNPKDAKRAEDPNAHTAALCALYKKYVLFVLETNMDDHAAPIIKMLTGGDEIMMRPMFGKPFCAAFLAKIFILSNFPLLVKQADPALALRLSFGLACAARFGATDDPENGQFLAADTGELRAKLDRLKAVSFLIFAECAREFKQNGLKLVPPPEGDTAVEAMKAASIGGAFKTLVLENYVSTLAASGKQGDWPKYGTGTAMEFSALYAEYEAERDKTDPTTYIDRGAAKAILNAMQPHNVYCVRDIKDPKSSRRYKEGVFLKKKEDTTVAVEGAAAA